MELRLDGKVVLVTGGSRGIGRAIALACVQAGARAMITSRKNEALEEAVELLGPDSRYLVANAGDPDAAKACAEATVEELGSIDILVNNAATNPYYGGLMGMSMSQADKTVQVNMRGVVSWTQAAWFAWMRDHGGVVLNISAGGGIAPGWGIGYYNATKAAVIHLTRQLAGELSPGVRVNAVAPGVVKTDMARALWEPDEEGLASQLPTRRLGEPADIANAALFLVSDAASWITGETLLIDGGALVAGAAERT